MAVSVRLAQKYDPERHCEKVIGWMMSEKLDGVRAIWDGVNFLTRNGNTLQAPFRMIAQLQNLPLLARGYILDGELYLGRGAFNETSGTVRRHEDEWFGIEFHVFDLYIPGSSAIFYQRHKDLQELIQHPKCPKFVKLVEQRTVRSSDYIWDWHDEITANGGEGVMLANPSAVWAGKRTNDLLKVKSFKECEATVIGYEEGKGKYTGMVGALRCRLPSGAEFSCGSGLLDIDRVDATPFLNKRVTVKYFELSKDGVPRFPIFKGLRTDA